MRIRGGDDLWDKVRLWREGLIEAPSPDEEPGEFVIENARGQDILIHLRTPRKYVIDDEYGLGIYFRIREVFKHFPGTQQGFSDKYLIPLDHVQEISQAQSTRKNPEWAAQICEAAVKYAAKHMREDAGDVPILNVTDFRHEPFLGPLALVDFRRWLRTGERQIKTQTHYLAKDIRLEYQHSNPRNNLLEEITAFLTEPDGLRNVLVVHDKTMTRELTALATTLCEDIIKADPILQTRPVCYVPMGKHIDNSRPFRVPDIIAILDAFYANRAVEEAERPTSTREHNEAIKRVRCAMAERRGSPAILIFDGCSDARNPLTSLKRVIADDPLAGVLDSLLYPLVDRRPGAWDPSIFYRTRILILADGPCHDYELFSYSQEELPPPPRPLINQTLIQRFPNNIGRQIHDIAGNQSGDETLVALLHALICAADHTKTPLRPRMKLVQPIDAMEQVSKRLQASERFAVDLMVIRFCALSNSGLRRVTLARLLYQWSLIISESAPLYLRLRLDHMICAISEAAERYPTLIIDGCDEQIPGLDDHLHHLEYPDAPLPALLHDLPSDWHTKPYSLDIRNPSLREVVISEMERSLEPSVIKAMHRLLAEEAIRQQTIIERHSPRHNAQEIRFYRRSLQALYHGFNSISNSLESSQWFKNEELKWAVLPADAADAFRNLYTMFYRSHIEAPPHWELSRVLGGDRVKADLLWVAVTAPSECSDDATAQEIIEGLRHLLGSNRYPCPASTGSLNVLDPRLALR